LSGHKEAIPMTRLRKMMLEELQARKITKNHCAGAWLG
jgi:hypothetical protein